MKFNKLVALLDKTPLKVRTHFPAAAGDNDPELDLLVSDSRSARKGAIFACVTGEHSDGHDYASKAAEAGASAVLCERQIDGVSLPQIICANVRRNMGTVAATLYENPIEKLTMIALTGTAGKTTSSFMTRSILQNAGIKTGLLGTVYYNDGVTEEDAERTTPEGSELQTWLHRMVQNSCKACVMETSSHALAQGRLEGALYDRAGFTNLSVDHLDFHGDMESYFGAKKLLFDKYMRGNWRASVNIDNEYGVRLLNEYGSRIITFGINNAKAMFSAKIINSSINGMEVEIRTPDSASPTKAVLPLLGEHNVLNALQALSLAWTLGIRNGTALGGLIKMEQVPGRLERYMVSDSGSCVIDFAHTPDELEKALNSLKPVCRGKLFVVFGAGGDRDRSKRPMMGEIATRIADEVIITSDNPRTENPEFITSEIEVGAREHSSSYKVIVDRKEAMYEGLQSIGEDDILLIAGRGPERFQITNAGPIPFLDKDVVAAWCAAHGKSMS